MPSQHDSPSYKAWDAMIQRCFNKNCASFSGYGGRGITVCDRWRKFPQFLTDMGERPAGLSLDRINNDGNYEPGNCRWATIKQQARNRRSTRIITFQGQSKTETEWCELLGVYRGTVSTRLKAGLSIAEALTRPPRVFSCLTFNGVSCSIEKWSHRTGIPRWTIRRRLNNGWTLEAALTTPSQPIGKH